MTEYQKKQLLAKCEEEYANSPELQEQFVSPKTYGFYRIAQSEGRVKESPKDAKAAPGATSAATAGPMSESEAKAQAVAEWAKLTNGQKSNFVSEKAYVGYRTADLMGRIKGTPSGNASGNAPTAYVDSGACHYLKPGEQNPYY
jgi:hypothetical protein